MPRPGHPLQLLLRPILESDLGSGKQVFNGARHQHLAPTCKAGDPRRYVHGEADEIVAANLDLADMDSGTNLKADSRHLIHEV